MASSTNQSVSTPRITWTYDVFVSFRGEDTRNNFTDHLFGAFHRQGIFAFRDDTKLKKGKHIESELLNAIEESHILVVVFSRNYASSTWCLRELVKIADCIGVHGQRVLPIFYDVSPSEVRKQSGDFEKAFMEHEERFKESSEEVQRWRRALTQVANLSGWDVKDKQQYAEIAKIVKRVTCLLGNKTSTLSDDTVGMDSRVEDIKNRLILDSNDDVRVVGIFGMGGIGKTTLAKALYARISDQFDARCFIDDVSKVYGGYGPIGVQKELLCQTLNEDNLQIYNHCMASNLIQTRLSQIKCLVVLDNVDQPEQLNKLAMKRECLGNGSRVIVISRDRHILIGHEADEVYNVQPLDHKNALLFFCRKAFKSDSILSDYIDLPNDVLRYCKGLPLAIEVLGSFLYDLDVSEWRSALTRLRENPMPGIMDVLRISFDGLEDTEKNIFLDIACFFHGNNEEKVKRILDFRGFYPEIGLRVLMDKSFITCEKGFIFMHDMLKELGKSIVREKSPNEPRKWNRLWDYKDVHKVISENMATENLEAIVMRHFVRNIEEMQARTTLRVEALAHMSRLKLLILKDLNFLGSLSSLSSELGYLYWKKYPFTCLPSRFEPDKLVELTLPHSNIKQLWKGTKLLHNLTHIDLSHSKNLIMMPSFLEIPNLEFLDLKGCIKLMQIDPSIGILSKLSKLNLKDCKHLVSIPVNIFGLSSLKDLNLSGCPKLLNNQLLKNLSEIENLEMLDKYKSTSFINKVLTSSFRFSVFQKHEDIIDSVLPTLSRVSCLRWLDLSFCNLVQIPNAIGWLHSLESLNLRGNNFVTLPSSMKELSKLRDLNLEKCKQLKCLPELPSKTMLPASEDPFGYHARLNVFDCPNLIETECYKMVFSWMIQLLQVRINSSFRKSTIQIVIPRTEIPKWFKKQNVGSSISMDPLPNMDDKNLIGVACWATFVAHNGPTGLGNKRPVYIGLGFKYKQRGIYPSIPIHLGKDSVTVELHHLLLFFFTREEFVDHYLSYLTKGSHDISGIKLASASFPFGLHLEVKNIGYHWILKEDLEQLKTCI